MNEKIPTQKYEGWTILEILGHRRLGGFVTEMEIAGHGFLRIDIPDEGDTQQATQFYAPSSVYCLTPTTEAMAKAVALRNKPEPVQRWELPQIEAPLRRATEQTPEMCDCGHTISVHDDDGVCDFKTCHCPKFTQNNCRGCGHAADEHTEDTGCPVCECTRGMEPF